MELHYVNAKGSVTLQTDRSIGSGGEADVYTVADQPDLLAKIYKKPHSELEDKLRYMLKFACDVPATYSWPQALLYDPLGKGGNFRGYLMAHVQDTQPLALLINPELRRRASVRFDYRYVLNTAKNLCHAIYDVHRLGCVIGDVSVTNILVDRNTQVTLIDCDSFQCGPYRCTVASPEYMAPELHNVALDTVERTQAQDNFALAILVHLLLMGNTHPFAGAGEPAELAQRVRQGLSPYVANGPAAPPWAPPLTRLPPQLQAMFRTAFDAGHTRPQQRPDARQWIKALQAAKQELTACRNNDSHYYFRHLDACPECHDEQQAASANNACGIGTKTAPGRARQQPMGRKEKELVSAIIQGQTRRVRGLVAAGADVNIRDKYGDAAIAIAARHEQIKLMRLLVKSGADVDARDSSGDTLLWDAVLMGRTKMVKLLAELGADVDAKGSSGDTALMHTALIGRTKMVRLLVGLGADVNATGAHGKTALMNAAILHRRTARVLLRLGADADITDDSGLSARLFLKHTWLPW